MPDKKGYFNRCFDMFTQGFTKMLIRMPIDLFCYFVCYKADFLVTCATKNAICSECSIRVPHCDLLVSVRDDSDINKTIVIFIICYLCLIIKQEFIRD